MKIKIAIFLMKHYAIMILCNTYKFEMNFIFPSDNALITNF